MCSWFFAGEHESAAGICGTAPESATGVWAAFRRAQDHWAFAFRAEFPDVAQDFLCLGVADQVGGAEQFHQACFSKDVDAALGCELFGFVGIAFHGDENAPTEAGVGQSAEELADSLHPYSQGLPLLALDCRDNSGLLDDGVDAAIWICSATASDFVTQFLVKEADELLEPEPVDSLKLLREFEGGAGVGKPR